MNRKAHPPAARPPAPLAQAGGADVWFLAYDIRQPRRLRRVHRCVRREGLALQYSGFAVPGDAQRLQALLDKLAGIIDARVDDVRAYHLPARCQVWSLGRQNWPEGLTLSGPSALQQLLAAAEHPDPADAEHAAQALADEDELSDAARPPSGLMPER
jgi:CRISPR-associated protein Cas2